MRLTYWQLPGRYFGRIEPPQVQPTVPFAELRLAVSVMVLPSTPEPMARAVAVMTLPSQATLDTYFEDCASKPVQLDGGSALLDDAYSATAVRTAEAARTTSDTFDFFV